MKQKRGIRGHLFALLLLFFAVAVAASCGGGSGGGNGGGGGAGTSNPPNPGPDPNFTLRATTSSLGVPAAIVDNDGNRAVIWSEGSSVFFARYTNGSWQTETPVFSNAPFGIGRLAIRTTGQGNLIAAWTEMTSSSLDVGVIKTSSYTPADGWTAPDTIANYSAHVDQIQIARDPNGNLVAVWSQREGPSFGYYNLWSSEKTPSTNWSTPTLRETDIYDVKGIRLHVTPTGTFTVLWQQPGPIYYARYTGSWTARTVLAPVAMTDSLAVAFSSNGEIVAAWKQAVSGDAILYISRYVPSAGWGTAQPFTVVGNDVIQAPLVAINDTGDSLVAWQFSGTASNWDPLKALRYNSTSGWEATANVDDNVYNEYPRSVFITNTNNGVIVRRDGNSSLVYYAYDPLTGWTSKQILYTSTGVIPGISTAVNLSGVGVIAWLEQVNSENQIRARLY